MPRFFDNLLSQTHVYVTLLLKACLLIGALALFFAGQYQAVMETLSILCITFFPMILGRRFRVKITHELESLAVLFICCSLFFGEVMDFYTRYWWWDIALHIFSGFLLGIMGVLLVYVLNEDDSINFELSPGFIAFFAFTFAMAMAALWEIFEYAADQTLGLNMQKSGLQDTMWDLIVDAMGALFIAVLGYRFLLTTETDSFLERWINRFISLNPQLFRNRGKGGSRKQ